MSEFAGSCLPRSDRIGDLFSRRERGYVQTKRAPVGKPRPLFGRDIRLGEAAVLELRSVKRVKAWWVHPSARTWDLTIESLFLPNGNKYLGVKTNQLHAGCRAGTS
jgi:hypothetical protein